MKNFERVCVSYANGLEIEDKAQKFYNILAENGYRMTCKEIAKIANSTYQRVSRLMKMLVELGLVERTEIDGEPIEVDVEMHGYRCDDGKPYTIEVDGIKYERISGGSRMKWQTWTEKKTFVPKIIYFKAIA